MSVRKHFNFKPFYNAVSPCFETMNGRPYPVTCLCPDLYQGRKGDKRPHEETDNLHRRKQSSRSASRLQISFAVTAKLISAFVFGTRKVHFLFFLNPKFQASTRLLCFYSPGCVGHVWKPHCWFSHEAAHILAELGNITYSKQDPYHNLIKVMKCHFTAMKCASKHAQQN